LDPVLDLFCDPECVYTEYRHRGWSVYKQKMPSETLLSASSLAMDSQIFLEPNEKRQIQVIPVILWHLQASLTL
jgi:hypothetical protein